MLIGRFGARKAPEVWDPPVVCTWPLDPTGKLKITWLGEMPERTMLEPPFIVIPFDRLKMNVSDDPPTSVRLIPASRSKVPVTLITFCPPLPVMVVDDVMLLNVCVGASAASALD